MKVTFLFTLVLTTFIFQLEDPWRTWYMMTASFLCLLFSPEAQFLCFHSLPSTVSSRRSEQTKLSPRFSGHWKGFLLKGSLVIQWTKSTHRSMGLFLNLFALNKYGEMIKEFLSISCFKAIYIASCWSLWAYHCSILEPKPEFSICMLCCFVSNVPSLSSFSELLWMKGDYLVQRVLSNLSVLCRSF